MLKTKKWLIVFFNLILLVSCNKQEKSVNTLKIDFQEGDLPSLHPHDLMIYLRGISIAKTLYEGLTRIDQKGQAKLAGAKSLEISTDQKQYTFFLRDNNWSDGSPVTAYQYEHAWKEALSPNSHCSRCDLLYLIKNAYEAKKGEVPLNEVGIKALDEKTLFVELNNPSPYFLELLAQPICLPLKEPKNKNIQTFNGAFQVDYWKHNDLLRLKPNPFYWNRSLVSLNQIDVVMVQDTMSAFSLFEKQQIDWIGVPFCPLSTELIGNLKQMGTLKTHKIDRAFWVFLNTQHPILRSASIRQALSLAIDRSTITSHILIGGHPLQKPIPSGILPLSTPSTLKEDRSLAQEKFEEGLKELGITKNQLPPLSISYSQQANRKLLAEYLQQTWNQTFEIQIQIQSQEWNVLRSNLEKGLFDISGCYEVAFYKDPLELLERFVNINSSNFSQWVYPYFGKKIALAKQEPDLKRRMHLLSEAEQVLMEQMPFIPITSDMFLFSHHPKLKGFAFDYVGAVDFSYAYFSD